MSGFKGGFGGFGGNMQNLMRQAQVMKEQMEKEKEKLEQTDFTGSAGGGMVECVLSGNKEVKSIKFKPEIVDKDDIEMLEDLTISAINDALSKFKQAEQKTMPIGM